MNKLLIFSTLISSGLSLSGRVSAETLRTVTTVSDDWSFDPIEIDDIEKHELSDGLHSTLVEWDYNVNEIVSGLASAFYWKGTDLYFKLRPNTKTTKNDEISAKDVVFSLKRALISNRNQIGNLRDLLCQKSAKGEFDCPRIEAVDSKLVKLSLPYQSPAFVDFLSNANYGILLEKSVDKRTNRVTDFLNTTGAYGVKSRDSKGFIFVANKNHWNLKNEHPTEIEFTKTPKDVDATDWAIAKLKANEIDYIGITPGFTQNDYKKLQENFGNKASFHISDEISVTKLNFTVKGMKLPVEVRQTISKVVQEFVDKKRHGLPSYKRATVEFTIPGSYGSFTKADEEQLAALRAKLKAELPANRKIIIGVPDKGAQALMEKYLAPLADRMSFIIRDYSDLTLSCQKYFEDGADIISDSWDLGYVENFSAIALYVRRGIFPVRENAATDWINKYIATTDPGARLKLYHDLHVESIITNPSMIPMWTTPYRAVAINGWSLEKTPATESLVHLEDIYKKDRK